MGIPQFPACCERKETAGGKKKISFWPLHTPRRISFCSSLELRRRQKLALARAVNRRQFYSSVFFVLFRFMSVPLDKPPAATPMSAASVRGQDRDGVQAQREAPITVVHQRSRGLSTTLGPRDPGRDDKESRLTTGALRRC